MWVRLGAPDDRLRNVVASRNQDGRLEVFGGPGRLAVRLRAWFSPGGFEIYEAIAARRRQPAAMPQPFEFPPAPRSPD